METLLYHLAGERALIASAALMAHAALAGPRPLLKALGADRPAALMAACLRFLERKLNRERRNARSRASRGVIMVALMTVCAMLLALLAHVVFLQFPAGWLAEAAVLAALLGLRQAVGLSRAIEGELREGQLVRAREELEGTAWRNAALLDAHALMRAGVEEMSLAACERVCAPLFWYLLLGLPGATASRMGSALSRATYHARDAFGRSAERVHAALQFLPSLLTGMAFIGVAAVLPFGRPLAALNAFFTSLGSGFRLRLLAIAGAGLNISLAGPLSPYAPPEKTWKGGAIARAMPRDGRRARLLLWGSAAFMLMPLLTLALPAL